MICARSFGESDLPKAGMLNPAVYNADNDVALGKSIAHVGEIGTSTAAIAIDQMAIQTAFVAEKVRAGEHRAPRSAKNEYQSRI